MLLWVMSMLWDIVIRIFIVFIFVMSIPNVTHLYFVQYSSFNLIDRFVTFGAICLVAFPIYLPSSGSIYGFCIDYVSG